MSFSQAKGDEHDETSVPYVDNRTSVYCPFPFFKEVRSGIAPIPCSMALVLFYKALVFKYPGSCVTYLIPPICCCNMHYLEIL